MYRFVYTIAKTMNANNNNNNRLDTLRIEKVKYWLAKNGRKVAEGTLYITLTEIIFLSKEGQEVWIVRSLVDSVERLPATTEGNPIVIRCKNFNRLTFVCSKDRECVDVIASLSMRCSSIEDLYCFRWQPSECDNNLTRNQGWSYFDLQTEFLRLGAPNDEWEVSRQNANYQLCETYPQCILLPKRATPHMIIASSRFRSRGRLPVLTYLHRFNKASIVRCAQPLVGFSARCKEDEDLLEAIHATNPGSDFLWVVDTRPMANAMGNKMTGKGYETADKYTCMRFKFAPIENIHVMRTSLAKLIDALQQTNLSISEYTSRIQQSGWLRHIQLILETAAFIADEIEGGRSVLIHCSDGWDRTAQTAALAQVLLDPYYRTLHGFQALIEKDFLAFGHKFTDRCGHLDGSSVTSGGGGVASSAPTVPTTSNSQNSTSVFFSAAAAGSENQSVSLSSSTPSSSSRHEMSPVFLQFLDCVMQLAKQQPTAFQFNERFLCEIHEETHSCRFGTFVGNCEKDRFDLRLSERSHSFWGYVQQHVADYINPMYCRDTEAMVTKRLRFSLFSRDLTIWRNLYCRFDSSVLPRESHFDSADALLEHNASLEISVRLMEESITSLCRQLGKSEEVIRRKLAGIVSSQSAMQLSQLFPSSFGISATLPPSSKLESITERQTVNDENDDVEGDYYDGEREAGEAANNGLDQALPQSPNQLPNSQNFSELDSQQHSVTTTTERRRSSLNNNNNNNNNNGNNNGNGAEVGSADLDSSGPVPQSPLLGNLPSLLCEQPLAIEWQSLRKTVTCRSCKTAFNGSERKRHCWHCGFVFCGRCVRPSPWKYPAPITSPSSGKVTFSGGPVSCRNCLRVASSSSAST